MDRRRLHLFREVAVRGTVIDAADAAFVTPSAVSQQLAALQRETGLTLFERHGRRLALTPDGAALLEDAERVLAAFEAAEATVAARGQEVIGTVGIGCFASAAQTFVARAVRQLAEDHPRLRTVVHHVEPQQAMAELVTGHLEIAIFDDLDAHAARTTSRLTSEQLTEDQLWVLLPADHPQARRRVVPLTALAEDRWLVDHPGTHFHSFRVRPRRAREVGSEAGRSLGAAG